MPMDSRHTWGHLHPRLRGRRARSVGSRVLALGLAVCMASGAVISPSAAAQQAVAAPAAHSVSGQVPTPTPTPVMIVPIELGTPITISPNLTPSTMQLQATPTPQAITVGGCAPSPDQIYQGCTVAPAGAEGFFLRRLEAQAIASVLQQYQLPESERPRVLRYARNEVRAALFAQLMEVFGKAPTARLPDEWLLANAFTRLFREKRVEAATAAQAEYRRWAANPCGYRPPPGFSYDARSACIGMSSLFTPESPGLRAFAAYGAAAAYKAVQEDPRTAEVFSATSNAAVLGYGYAAALGLGVAGAALGYVLPASVFSAIFPYITYLGDWFLVGAIDLPTITTAGAAGAGAIGGTLLVVIGAVTTAIVAGRSVFNEAAIPGDLRDLVEVSRSFDVGHVVRNYEYGQYFNFSGADVRKAVDQELYAVFILNTMPDYPGTDPAPAAQPGDPRFVVAGSPVDRLQYTAADGSQRVVRLSGQWFADRAASAAAGTARLTLSISYRDAAGAAWTARRVGNQFLIVRVGDPTAADYPAPQQSADLTVVDSANRPVTARVGG